MFVTSVVRYGFALVLLLCGFAPTCHAAPVSDSLNNQLLDAAWTNNAATVRNIITQGANVNVMGTRSSDEGMTPLMRAAYGGFTDCAVILMNAGAKVNTHARGKYVEGMTALMWAAIGGNPVTIGLLLRHHEDPEAGDQDHRTALMYAGAEGSPANVAALLKGGAKINACRHGETALDYAACAGRTDNVKMLLQFNADVNVKEAAGRTALMAAVMATYANKADKANWSASHVEMVKALLDKGADVRAVDDKGQTALDYALKDKDQQIVDLLRKAKARR